MPDAQTDDPATKPLLRALRGHIQSPPPIWLMRQAGRYLPEYRAVRARTKGFLDLCFTPDLAAEVTLQPVHRFGLDAAILFSDILVVPWALGQPLAFVEGEGPKLDPVATEAALAELAAPDAAAARLAPVAETVARTAAALPADTALIGFAGAPWTVATYMVEGGSSRDFAAVKAWALGDPDSFQHLIDLVVATTVRYLDAQIAAGAEAVQLFDSWAGALDAGAFARWVTAANRAVVEGVRARHPEVPIIGFPRGAGLNYHCYVDGAGVDALGVDQGVPLDLVCETLQARIPVQGTLDPMYLRLGGPTLDRAVDEILESLAGGPFVFNLGHGVMKETPPEHVARLVARVRGD